MRDLVNNINAVQSIAPAVLTDTVTGASVDLKGYNSAVLVINTGAIAGAGNFEPELFESEDNVEFSAVDYADLDYIQLVTWPVGTLAANTVYRMGYKGSKRYVRPVLTRKSGTSIAASALVIRGHAQNSPLN
jgi:hypothetical protein